MGIVNLRSIPPANRTDNARAIPRTGIANISLGRAAHEARQANGPTEKWKPSVFQKKSSHASKPSNSPLIDTKTLESEVSKESEWWKTEIERLKNEFSLEALESLLKDLTKRFNWENV